MNRRDFVSRGLALGICPGLLFSMATQPARGAEGEPADGETKKELQRSDFVKNWLTDLMEGIHDELDPATRRRVMAAAGRGCYKRHPWKHDIAAAAGGTVDGLVTALKKNFEAWREGDALHVRYGEKSTICYCPAANYRPPVADDPHCECTRAMHAAIMEAALGRPVKVEIVASVRRGGPTCHFVANVAGFA